MTRGGFALAQRDVGSLMSVSGRPRTAGGRSAWNPIPPAVRRTVLLFVATLPFEQVVMPFLPGRLPLPKIAGLLFLGVCLWYPKTCFRRPAPAVLCFCVYLAVCLVLGIFIPSELRAQFRSQFLTKVQVITFFWLGSVLMREIQLARSALLTFGVATAGLAIGALLGIPGIARTGEAGGRVRGTRISALDFNPNELAALVAIAAIMLIGLLLDNTRRTRVMTWLLRGLIVPLMALLVGTSSRGGLMAFVLGMSPFLVPMAPSRRRIAAFALGFLALIAVGLMVARNPVSVARWSDAAGGGGAGRETIYPTAVAMFLERPILGWGPVEFLYELGSRLGLEIRDPHNLLLWLLLEVGIVGAVFFLAGFGLCARGAWRSRRGPEGVLPLALIVAVTVINLSGTFLISKPMWLILSIALASPVVSTTWQRAISGRNAGLEATIRS